MCPYMSLDINNIYVCMTEIDATVWFSNFVYNETVV